MSVPIQSIIDKCLGSGFDSELKVSSNLVSAGWSASQSVYYIDKDEKKGRELDILAHRGFSATNLSPEITLRLYLCIEVKKAEEPEIFFSNTSARKESLEAYGLLHWKKRVNPTILPSKSIEKKRPMVNEERCARSYMSFKSQGTQKLKSGVLSAFKAAIHWKDKCDERYSKNSHDICFFIPMVVIDGPIAECFFREDNGELSAKYIEKISYLQNYQSPNYGSVSAKVIVTTYSKLTEILNNFDTWGKSMLSTMVANQPNFRDTE